MYDAEALSFAARGIVLDGLLPLIDGDVPQHGVPIFAPGSVIWPLAKGRFVLKIELGDPLKLTCRIEGAEWPLASLGLRFSRVSGVRCYLRNGYQSWDGSFFIGPGTAPGDGPPGKAPTLGFALTALLPYSDGALVLGFERHDRYQTRFHFGGTNEEMLLEVETLLDRTGQVEGETLVMFEGNAVEPALRRWSQLVAAVSSPPPRLRQRRITGWCSWYNHYAMIDEPTIRAELESCRAFRDTYDVPLDVFQIDDGFTPEMGDWLDVKPQFPSGIRPLLADVAAAGFIPGLWIAPFMVGNRSKLYAAHPEWVVQDASGGPLVQMKFYGEFRWHKRSEEYYILDITHPDAAAWIGTVFRTWRRQWGAGYFKTDFMLFGSEHGPDRAVWHEAGLSRIAIWRRMATIIREAIGDALWLGCGCPLWASVGLVDAVRVGRDIGVAWEGEYLAESLLRDLATRHHANGILWQADPDCVLLRHRFHDMTDTQITSLANFACASGGVLMTSDTLAALTPERAEIFADILRAHAASADFPALGQHGPVLYAAGGRHFVFNTAARPVDYAGQTIPPFATIRL